MKIVADSHIPYIDQYFGGYGELLLKPGRSISREDVRDADMLLVRSITHVDEKLLQDTKVKFVGSVTAGADHLDTKWLDERGILWSVAMGFNAPPVADYVVSVVASLQSKELLLQKNMKAAVIGVGKVGRLVADRLRMLGFEIILCDPLRAEQESDFISTALSELSDVDLITLHVPLTKTGKHPTYHFIDKHFLQKQKPDCVLINASRGSVIQSKDLLQYGSHLNWCFEVWEHEPHIDIKILESALIATPHIAGYSVQSKIRGIDMIYQIACDLKMIEAKPITPIAMPRQRLSFSGKHSWQEIVLGVFNPAVITTMMRTLLLTDDEDGKGFDEMRNQFNYRYELGYSNVMDAVVAEKDAELLRKLGVRV
jgi:erythronate-4-phosphate dehydrogenase